MTTRNNTTIAQMDRGIEVGPIARDQALSALVTRMSRVEDGPNEAFPHPNHGDENDSPSAFVRNLRAKRTRPASPRPEEVKARIQWKNAWTKARANEAASWALRNIDPLILRNLLNAHYQTSGLTRLEQHERTSWLHLAMGCLHERDAVEAHERFIQDAVNHLHRIEEAVLEEEIFLPQVALNDAVREIIQQRRN